jgi:pyruvate,water dikinase
VFYLTLDEHDRLISGEGSGDIKNLQRKIDRVKQEMDAYRDISLPSVIYGETPPPVVTQDETMLKGIPVSPGLFEGEVVVVKGYQDFKKNVEGRILVIPFSDVGWTPILSRAGAIVAESGGLLSHASIIARELAIPAIASVDHACNLKDGIMGRLDGYNGLLILKA